MKNKILFTFLSLALVFGVGFAGAQVANAQVAPSFAMGCTSNLGYSVTNGSPCNGTSNATMNISGCTTALGYSVTTGTPCDGAAIAISYLAGCSSINGFSTISGLSCDGTNSVSGVPVVVAPGLPVTGAGSDALLNVILLLSSALVVAIGSVYLVRKYKMNV